MLTFEANVPPVEVSGGQEQYYIVIMTLHYALGHADI